MEEKKKNLFGEGGGRCQLLEIIVIVNPRFTKEDYILVFGRIIGKCLYNSAQLSPFTDKIDKRSKCEFFEKSDK